MSNHAPNFRGVVTLVVLCLLVVSSLVPDTKWTVKKSFLFLYDSNKTEHKLQSSSDGSNRNLIVSLFSSANKVEEAAMHEVMIVRVIYRASIWLVIARLPTFSAQLLNH